MTGYGRALVQEDGRQITIEIKSVNHRFLDLNLRMPRSFLFLEDEMRKAVARRLARGHVDLFVTYKNLRPDARSVRVDQALLGAYMRSLGEVEGLEDDRTLLNMARLPEVLQIEENPEDEEALRALTTQALERRSGISWKCAAGKGRPCAGIYRADRLRWGALPPRNPRALFRNGGTIHAALAAVRPGAPGTADG